MTTYSQRLIKGVTTLAEAGRVVAFTGAGISTGSGISDFRSPGGVWDRYRTITYQEFLASADARREYWAMKRDLFREMHGASPNAAHKALAHMERIGRLHSLITQNIDGLHQDAGSSAENVIELHGTNRRASCLSCHRQWPIEEIQAILEAGELDPRCESCGGFIKPMTVSFGQSMPEREMLRAFECASRCSALIMIGSSLSVEPAASIVPAAHRAGASLIFVNRTETPWDHIADVRFTEDATTVLPDLAGGLAPIED